MTRTRGIVIGPHIWGSGGEAERARRAVFSWLTRSGIGVKFGTRPIGPYQQHQVAAIDAIEERAKAAGIASDSIEMRVRGGEVMAHPPGGRWQRLGRVDELYRDADRRGAR